MLIKPVSVNPLPVRSKTWAFLRSTVTGFGGVAPLNVSRTGVWTIGLGWKAG